MATTKTNSLLISNTLTQNQTLLLALLTKEKEKKNNNKRDHLTGKREPWCGARAVWSRFAGKRQPWRWVARALTIATTYVI